jgi:uncharacterized membrane protein
MSMLISMVFSFIIISPLSTVAIAIAIGISGIAAGLLTWLVPINNTASVAAIPIEAEPAAIPEMPIAIALSTVAIAIAIGISGIAAGSASIGIAATEAVLLILWQQ